MSKRIAVIVGSLRKDSFNRKVAKALVDMAPASLQFEFVEIGDLPLYNQDLDQDPPQPWVKFRQKLKAFDGVLFATPEYNRSVPGVLKNAIDVGSRPYGASAWDKRPCAIVSVSPGAMGGFGANHHLRQCLVFLNMPAMQMPEAYIGSAGDLFEADGAFKKPSTKEHLQKFINSFANWVERNAP